MNIVKATITAAFVTACCLGNEMPANANATKAEKLAALDEVKEVLTESLTALRRGDPSKICSAQKRVEELLKPYDYFGQPQTFGPAVTKKRCDEEKRLMQVKANSPKPNNSILNECRKEWGTDYAMVKYCFDEQTSAKRALGL